MYMLGYTVISITKVSMYISVNYNYMEYEEMYMLGYTVISITKVSMYISVIIDQTENT